MAAPAQLQRATRELQAALQSVRKRRESLGEAAAAEKRGGSAEIGCEGQENDAWRCNGRDFDAKSEFKRPGARVEACRGLESEERGVPLGISQLSIISGLSGIEDLGGSDSDEWSVEGEDAKEDSQETIQTRYAPSCLEAEARKALSWMQADVERQARINKDTAGHLLQAVRAISDAVVNTIPGEESDMDLHDLLELRRPTTDQSSMLEIVDAIVDQWKRRINRWVEQQETEQRNLSARLLAFRDECENRLNALESSHRSDCDHLQQHIDAQRQRSDRREMTYEDERTKLSDDIEDMREFVETSKLELVSTTKSRHFQDMNATHEQHLPLYPVSSDGQDLINLTAQLKEADLRVLRWQMAFEEQVETNSELEARLQMTMEEQHARNEAMKLTMQDMVSRQHVETYRERIGWLEEHVHDMESQIACDREQFAFEVAKWEQEKFDARKELDEIRDVSVKLLKVLLIREKLSKRRDHEHSDRVANSVDKFRATKHAFQNIVKKLMEEAAALLLCSQGMSVQGLTAGAIAPAHVRAMIKQLKRLDRGLEKLDFDSALSACGEDTMPPASISTDSAVSDPDWAVYPARSFAHDLEKVE